MLTALLLVASCAGCLGSDQTDKAATENPTTKTNRVQPSPSNFAYTCPEGDTQEQRNGLCVQTIDATSSTLQEPYLAFHPRQPDLVALGVIAGRTIQSTGPNRPQPGVDAVQVDVYISQNGGRTWERHELPYIPQENDGPATVRATIDPALAWGDNETLHVTGISSDRNVGSDVFYVSTSNLGETWTNPRVFTTDNDNDRQWITHEPGGNLYVPWQNVLESSEIAWSTGSGREWKTQTERQQVEDCITTSPVVVHNQTPMFACAKQGNNGYAGIQIHALNTSTGNLTLQGTADQLPGNVPRLLSQENGVLLVLTRGNQTSWAAESTDGGQTWTHPVNLRERITIDDEWSEMTVYWGTLDPWGILHLLVVGHTPETARAGLGVGSERHVAHIAVDPTGFKPLTQRQVNPTGLSQENQAVERSSNTYGDEFYGIDFTQRRGLLAWTQDGAIKIAEVEPILSNTST